MKEQPWIGESYDISITYGNCEHCGRETTIGCIKTRQDGTETIVDNWLCASCRDKLESKIKREWRRFENK